MSSEGSRIKLSPNFYAYEFACKCGCCIYDGSQMDRAFIAKLQLVRKLYGKAMHINSGQRCPAHNRAIGGSKGSRHMASIAADVRARSSSERYELVRIAMVVKMAGIGVGQSFIHMDSREGPSKIWTY